MAGACWLLWRLHLMCVIFRNILPLITDTQQIILIILHIIFIHSEVEGLFLSHTLCRTFRPKCNINKHFGGTFVLTCSLRPSTPLFGTNLIFHVWRSNVNIWHYLITNLDGITKLTFWTSKIVMPEFYIQRTAIRRFAQRQTCSLYERNWSNNSNYGAVTAEK